MESTWLTWVVHRRSEVRTRPRCLCILTFFRVLPLRLIAKSEEKGCLVNSIDTVLSTLTANFHSDSHVDVASTDLCRWPSHSVGDGLTVVRALSVQSACSSLPFHRGVQKYSPHTSGLTNKTPWQCYFVDLIVNVLRRADFCNQK